MRRAEIVLRSLGLALVGLACGGLPGLETASASTIRVATFNASMNRNAPGDLLADLANPQGNTGRINHLKTIAEIIQRIDADVILINEFDYAPGNTAVDLFRSNYLEHSQNVFGIGPTKPVTYGHAFTAPSNTGIASGFDLNNNGVTVTTPGAPGYGDDSLGFGAFPGQFGMAVLSKLPILTDDVRTFQNFLWKDMPGALLPDDPSTLAPQDWYSPEELAVFRLSSKSHWDIPVQAGSDVFHLLAAHPTPPVFDGPEDRNGTRNHDEIRFWKDYVNDAGYIYDDAGVHGGLDPDTRFVIVGDYNSDPLDGDSIPGSTQQLLGDPLINAMFTPSSAGGPQQSALQGGANLNHLSNPAFDTADFADGAPGNLRADLVLPSDFGFNITGGGVFWPSNTDPLFPLVGTFNPSNFWAGFPSSDHRAVYLDLQSVPEPSTLCLTVLASFGTLVFGHSIRHRGRRQPR